MNRIFLSVKRPSERSYFGFNMSNATNSIHCRYVAYRDLGVADDKRASVNIHNILDSETLFIQRDPRLRI